MAGCGEYNRVGFDFQRHDSSAVRWPTNIRIQTVNVVPPASVNVFDFPVKEAVSKYFPKRGLNV